MYQAESQFILAALGKNARCSHHIGSTAIPSIVAKPVIDILIVVAELERVDECNSAMEKLGYEAMGEYGIPFRRYFRKENSAGNRTHHVHIFPEGNGQVDRHLAFRDFMNLHPEWALRYSNLKRNLVARYPDSIDQYMNGKQEFIKRVDELAAAWKLEQTRPDL